MYFGSSDTMSANIGYEVTSLVGPECVKGLHIHIWPQIYNGASDLLKTITLTEQVLSKSVSSEHAV